MTSWPAAGGDPGALPDALVEGFQSAFLGGAVIAVIGLVLTLVLIRGSDSRAHVALSKDEPDDEERPREATDREREDAAPRRPAEGAGYP